MRHRRWLVGIALPVVLLVGACSGGSSHGIATAHGATSALSTASGGDQGFIDYARCMREHGVADFPDPVQRSGYTGLSLHYDGDQSNSVFVEANTACQHFIQATIDQKRQHVHDELTAERLQALLSYARCMRDHQIALLDPDPTDGHISLGDVPGLNSNIGRHDQEFQTADAACRSLLPSDVPDDGTGPP
jgi:hypothetical protein